jgi:hypothetical protein
VTDLVTIHHVPEAKEAMVFQVQLPVLLLQEAVAAVELAGHQLAQ